MVVEDGTGLSNANAYVSRADADVYHSERGREDWLDATEVSRDVAIIRATQWMDGLYRHRWRGGRIKATQALEWPRRGFDTEGFELSGVPRRVPQAVCEAAYAIIKGVDLTPVLERGGAVKREKVGPIETEYFEGAPARATVTAVSDLLRGYLRGPGLRITV